MFSQQAQGAAAVAVAQAAADRVPARPDASSAAGADEQSRSTLSCPSPVSYLYSMHVDLQSCCPYFLAPDSAAVYGPVVAVAAAAEVVAAVAFAVVASVAVQTEPVAVEAVAAVDVSASDLAAWAEIEFVQALLYSLDVQMATQNDSGSVVLDA